MLKRCLPLPLLLLLGGCAVPPPPAAVTLPESAEPRHLGDPIRGAILSSAHVFGRPASVAGNPAAAAEALGQLEYLTVELHTGGRWQGDFDPLVVPLLQQGRAEARAAMGMRADASPQAALDAWYAAAAALRAGDRARAEAALAPVVAEPAAALRRLAELPYLPRAAAATGRALAALIARDRDRRPLF